MACDKGKNEAKRREVIQLLKDWRTFDTAFGGAASLDAELNLEAKGNYGPAGLIMTGVEFDKADRKLLETSYITLWGALVRLQQKDKVGKHSNGDPISGAKAYNALREPHLQDPADYSIVDEWRTRVCDLDNENRIRARRKPPQPPRIALVTPRRYLEAYDAAIDALAEDLQNEDLHVVFAKRMSEDEERKVEDQNTEMLAVFNRLRRSGLKIEVAIQQTASDYGVSRSTVERVIEFRSDIKPDTCMWGGCDRAPFSQNLCKRHYDQQWRNRRKGKAS